MSMPAVVVDREATFRRELLAWVNRRFAREGVLVTEHTPLFAGRVIDSLRILELIAFTERALGIRIPDAAIRMDNFQTIARIARVFAGGTAHADP